MKGIRLSAFMLAIGLAATAPASAIMWDAGDAYAASKNLTSERTKARADCGQQANQRKLAVNSIHRRNFLRQCFRERGFAGRP